MAVLRKGVQLIALNKMKVEPAAMIKNGLQHGFSVIIAETVLMSLVKYSSEAKAKQAQRDLISRIRGATQTTLRKEETMSLAYSEGADAQQKGICMDENPYKNGTDRWEAYQRGYLNASVEGD